MSEINDEETPKEDDDVLKSKVKLMKVAVRRLKSLKKKINCWLSSSVKLLLLE